MLSTMFMAAMAASSATAMLVPTEMADSVTGFSTDALAVNVVDPTNQILHLECTGCPVATKGDDDTTVWTFGPKNELFLNFKVEDNKIMLNGDGQFFPMESPEQSPRLVAAQIVNDEVAGVLPLGYALEVRTIQPANDETAEELLVAHFSIVDLAGMPVTVDTVVVTAINTADQGLMIAKIDTIPAERPTDLTGENCKTGLCRLRAALYARLQAFIDAARAKASSFSAGIFSGCAGSKGAKMGAHGGRPHGQGHHGQERPHWQQTGINRHHRHHPWARAVARVLYILVLPAALGIIGGLLTSMIGMLVGQAVIFLWIKFARGGRRGDEYERVEQQEDEVDSDDEDIDSEKANLIAADKMFDRYTDEPESAPPVYEEKEVKE